MAGSFAYERLKTVLAASKKPESYQKNMLKLLEASETGSAFLEDSKSYTDQYSNPRDKKSPTWHQQLEQATQLPAPTGSHMRSALAVSRQLRSSATLDAIAGAIFLHTMVAQAPSDISLRGLRVALIQASEVLITAIMAVRNFPLDDIRAELESIRTNENNTLSTRQVAGNGRQLVDAVRGSYGAQTLRSLHTSIDTMLATPEGDDS
jgi:hypothetical protein